MTRCLIGYPLNRTNLIRVDRAKFAGTPALENEFMKCAMISRDISGNKSILRQ